MSWYKVTLSGDDISANQNIALQDAFEAVYIVSGAPKKAVLFSHRNSRIYEYYFSPAAASISMAIISRFGGVECPAPRKSDVHPLVSHDAESDSAWE